MAPESDRPCGLDDTQERIKDCGFPIPCLPYRIRIKRADSFAFAEESILVMGADQDLDLISDRIQSWYRWCTGDRLGQQSSV